jgi:electron transfer flavoprotein alpha subunit
MSAKIWVHAEVMDGKIAEISLELLTKARGLAKELGDGAKVEATLIGSEVESEAASLSEYGASTVYAADSPSLAMYSPMTWVPVLTELAEKHRPDIYLFGATSTGAALGPALAARLRTGMAAHCVDLRINEEGLLAALVPSFGGKVIGEILCPRTSPQMASVKRGVFVKGDPSPVPLRLEKVPAPDYKGGRGHSSGWVEPRNAVKLPPRGMPLCEANVVVCGGYGLGGEENWRRIEELAEYLGGAAACTRPAVDEGWADERRMIGTSGQSVRPKVYLGFGISGATHHICGMNESGVIINVNSDADAPIFEVSDFRAVADAAAILPLLIEALKPPGNASLHTLQPE